MELTIEACKNCGQGFTFLSEETPSFPVAVAPDILVYLPDCPACGAQNMLSRDTGEDEMVQDLVSLGVPEGYARCHSCGEASQAEFRFCPHCGSEM